MVTEDTLTHTWPGPGKFYRKQTYPYMARTWEVLQKTDLAIHGEDLGSATENRLTHTWRGLGKCYRRQTYPYMARTWEVLQKTDLPIHGEDLGSATEDRLTHTWPGPGKCYRIHTERRHGLPVSPGWGEGRGSDRLSPPK